MEGEAPDGDRDLPRQHSTPGSGPKIDLVPPIRLSLVPKDILARKIEHIQAIEHSVLLVPVPERIAPRIVKYDLAFGGDIARDRSPGDHVGDPPDHDVGAIP